MNLIIGQILVAAIELYRNHYKLAADWVPTIEDINRERLKNAEWTAAKYEIEAARIAGVEPLPPPS